MKKLILLGLLSLLFTQLCETVMQDDPEEDDKEQEAISAKSSLSLKEADQTLDGKYETYSKTSDPYQDASAESDYYRKTHYHYEYPRTYYYKTCCGKPDWRTTLVDWLSGGYAWYAAELRGDLPEGFTSKEFDEKAHGWNVDAQAGFGTLTPDICELTNGDHVKTIWPDGKRILAIRKKVYIPKRCRDVMIILSSDFETTIYWDGLFLGDGEALRCPIKGERGNNQFFVENEFLDKCGHHVITAVGSDTGARFIDIKVTAKCNHYSCNYRDNYNYPMKYGYNTLHSSDYGFGLQKLGSGLYEYPKNPYYYGKNDCCGKRDHRDELISWSSNGYWYICTDDLNELIYSTHFTSTHFEPMKHGWIQNGRAPFGTIVLNTCPLNTNESVNTLWPENKTYLVIRKELPSLKGCKDIRIHVSTDHEVCCGVNGEFLGIIEAFGCAVKGERGDFTFPVEEKFLDKCGKNVISLAADDRGSIKFLDARVTANCHSYPDDYCNH